MKTSLLTLALVSISSSAMAADFDGNFALDQWTITPMTGGTAEADPTNDCELDCNEAWGGDAVHPLFEGVFPPLRFRVTSLHLGPPARRGLPSKPSRSAFGNLPSFVSVKA